MKLPCAPNDANAPHLQASVFSSPDWLQLTNSCWESEAPVAPTESLSLVEYRLFVII